jgi:multidrug resistance efflux pump
MDGYEPIPVPPQQLWREFRIRYIPLFVFTVVLLCALILWRSRLGPATVLGETENVTASIQSSQTGVLAELKVRSFQSVKAGEPLGKVVGADPKNAATLVSPIDGAVTYLHRQAGDKVTAGEPLIIVSGDQPDRIVAFLRQPIAFAPAEGMKVSVRARARDRREAEARILKVSPQLSPIPASLLPGHPVGMEKGLPILVSVPPELKLYPGEIVELRIFAGGTKESAPAKAAAK